MKFTFRATAPDDHERISDLFARSFSVSVNAPALNRELMTWKFWSPRLDAAGPRSYVLEAAGRIVAHCGLWPLQVRAGTRNFEGAHMIDWAADRAVPGAGTVLVKHFTRMFDFVMSIGGSEATQRILPAFGFQTVGEVWTAARPIRPFRLSAYTASFTWKTPARLARNVMWSVSPLDHSTPQCRPIDIEAYVTGCEADGARVARPLEFCAFLKQCPSAQFEFYAVENSVAVFAVSTTRAQARIVDVQPSSASLDERVAAYRAALNLARTNPDVVEVLVRGSGALSRRAAAVCGFRVCQELPVFVFSRNKDVSFNDCELQMLDNDVAFRNDGTMMLA